MHKKFFHLKNVDWASYPHDYIIVFTSSEFIINFDVGVMIN